jgi:hypothetical protein
MKNATFSKTRIKFLLTLAFISLFVLQVAAQYPRTSQRIFLGGEWGVGTRSLSLKSDLLELNQRDIHNGNSFGLLFGNETLVGHINRGVYKSSDLGEQSLKQIEMGGAIDLFPLKLLRSKVKYFSPFFQIGSNVTTLKLSGMYTPKPLKEEEPVVPAMLCTCPCCQMSMPAEEPKEKVVKEPVAPLPFDGKLTTTRINVGGGLQLNLQKKNYFVRLYAQAKYGVTVADKNNFIALENTKAGKQMSVDFGVSVGLSGKPGRRRY